MGPCDRLSRVSRRIGAISESATLAVDAKAKALKAAGRPVIGFGAGEPDFPTPDYIVEAAAAACRDPRWHRYTPAGGLPELQEAIAAKTLARLRLRRSRPAQVLVTNGGKQAALRGLRHAARPRRRGAAAGAVLDHLPGVDPAGRRGAGRGARPTRPAATWPPSSSSRRPPPTAPRCCCSCRRPTRPAPSTPPEQVEAIGRWAVERGLWVVTDEIYEHLVYGDARFASMPTLVPELADRCVVVNGVAKTYAMTGWRVGWLIGPADVVKAATNLQSHATSNVANVAPGGRADRGPRRPVGGGDDARGVRPAPADDREDAARHPGRRVPGAVRRVLRLPVGQGSPRHGAARPAAGQPAPSSASWCSRRPRWRWCRARRSARPGYVRMSYALGDDDLVEGVTRLHQLLAEATH